MSNQQLRKISRIKRKTIKGLCGIEIGEDERDILLTARWNVMSNGDGNTAKFNKRQTPSYCKYKYIMEYDGCTIC